MLTFGRLILQSLFHYRRVNASVALGVAAGTAVLTGALLVGDSMRESLRRLTLDRLGNVEQALVAQRFFRQEFAEEVASSKGFSDRFAQAAPAILLQGTVERPPQDEKESTRRAGNVSLFGWKEDFWAAGEIATVDGQPFQPPKSGEVVLNQRLADDLRAAQGDQVILRIPKVSQVSRDSALGAKSDLVLTKRFTVSSIVKSEGLGRFGLHPTQLLPKNAYLDLRSLQRTLDQYDRRTKSGRVNAVLLVAKGDSSSGSKSQTWQPPLPTLDDYGLKLEKTERGYLNLTSSRMLLSRPVEEIMLGDSPPFSPENAQPVMTYLANAIKSNGREVPYSTVAGIDFQAEPPLGPFLDAEGNPAPPLKDDEIALNDWAAEDLGIELGAQVTLDYFDPETTHGEVVEKSATFTLKAVVRLEGAAADPSLTPEFPGVTDQLSIGDWDPPFPFDSDRLREDKDEPYWDDHRATPKAFISLAAGQKLWQSRFGKLSSIRIRPQPESQTADQASELVRIRVAPASLGMAFQPIKEQQLRASSGATPFGLLFIGFSFFIIAAAVMLVALLFGLGVDSRARDVGVELASGLNNRQARKLLVREGFLVAALGGLLGVGIGIGYAWLMLAGLRSPWLWQAAVGSPFLQLHVTSSTMIQLAAGYLISVA
ncbi:MAG: ABC transporter permease, partial [Planctomycetales bacterium]